MQHDTEIAVISGGVGGVAGALAALRAGRRVVLTEESAWLGGQLTNQMVLGLAVPHLVVAMNIFLSRQYFAGMPTELGEAARIDGAGERRIFCTGLADGGLKG